MVLHIVLLLSSFFFMFFLHCRSFFADLLHFVHSDIYLISFHRRLSSYVSFQNLKTAFTSPIFSRNHLAKLSFVLDTLSFFEPVSKILYTQIKHPTLISIRPKGVQYVVPSVFVRPSISNLVSTVHS